MIGPPASPSLTGRLIPGTAKGMLPSSRPRSQTDENRNQVGFVELFDGIAEDFFDAFDRLRFTHYRQAVAQLQREIGRGEQLYARTMHPADVDAVQVSQTQRAEFAAVDFGAGDDDRPGDELLSNAFQSMSCVFQSFCTRSPKRSSSACTSSGEVITSTRSPDSRVESEVGIETCPARQRREMTKWWWLYAATSRMLLPTTPGLENLEFDDERYSFYVRRPVAECPRAGRRVCVRR